MKIRCVNCGKFYPEEELVCPECGALPDLVLCPECEAVCSAEDAACAYCGAPLEGRLAGVTEEDAAQEARILSRELKAEDTTAEDLRAIRRSLSLLSKYIDTDRELLLANRKLLSLDLAALKEDCAEKAEALKEDGDAIPAAELPEAIRRLDASGEEPELVELYRSRAEQARAKARRRRTLAACAVCAAVILAAGAVCARTFVLPSLHYASAESAFSSGDYAKAEKEYLASGLWKDAAEKADEAALGVHYSAGVAAIASGDYALAEDELKLSNGFLDASEQILAARYGAAEQEENAGNYAAAAESFAALGTYSDSASRVLACAEALSDRGEYKAAQSAYELLSSSEAKNGALYAEGMAAYESGDDALAIVSLEQVSGMSGAEETLRLARYRRAQACYESGDYAEAAELYRLLAGYEDADAQLTLSLFYEAEAAYAEGKLNTAAECYRALPEGYERDGVSVAARLKAIEDKSNFLWLCGLWTTDGSASYSVKKVNSTNGVWNQRAGTADGLQADIRCVILDNGRLHLEGSVQYMRFTAYDKETSEEELCTAELDQDILSFPYSFLADDHVKITVKADHVELLYSEDVQSYEEWYYYDKFETECSYETKLETY